MESIHHPFAENVHPLTYPQRRILYYEKIHPGLPLSNMTLSSRLEGMDDIPRLRRALQNVLQRMESLRLRLAKVKGETYQYISSCMDVNLAVYDSRGKEEEIEAILQRESETAFSLYDSPLYQFIIIQDAKGLSLFSKVHHIITDGFSYIVQMNLIRQEYDSAGNNNPEEQNNAPFPFLPSLERHREYIRSSRFLDNRKYWEGKLEKAPEVLLGKPRYDSSHPLKSTRQDFPFPDTLKQQVETFCDKSGITEPLSKLIHIIAIVS